MSIGPMRGPGRPVHPRVDGPDLVLTVPTAARMHELGRALAALLRRGDLLILDGPLGAGKTALVQGIGAGLGVQGNVVSPTFVIARVHPGGGDGTSGIPLVHVDAYRLSSLDEVDDLDLDVAANGVVTAVEWGGDRAEQLSDARLHLGIARAAESETRTVTLRAHGGDWTERLARLPEPRS